MTKELITGLLGAYRENDVDPPCTHDIVSCDEFLLSSLSRERDRIASS